MASLGAYRQAMTLFIDQGRTRDTDALAAALSKPPDDHKSCLADAGEDLDFIPTLSECRD